MKDNDDYFNEDQSKTSPIHAPSYDPDFPYTLYGLNSPISAPSYEIPTLNFPLNERFIDIPEQIDIGLIMKNYEKSVSEAEKKIEYKTTKLSQVKPKSKRLRKPCLYKPFASFESTELTVHQLRSVLSRPSRKRYASNNTKPSP